MTCSDETAIITHHTAATITGKHQEILHQGPNQGCTNVCWRQRHRLCDLKETCWGVLDDQQSTDSVSFITCHQTLSHAGIPLYTGATIPAFIPTSEGGKLGGVIENPSMAGLCLHTEQVKGATKGHGATIYKPVGAVL